MFRARLHRRRSEGPRRPASLLLAALVSLLLGVPSAASAQEPLTLDRAVDLALENDLSAQIAALAFEEAQVNYERSLAANLLEASAHARRSAENARRSAAIAYENARADIALATVDRYVAVLRGRLDLAIAEKRLEIARLDLASTERRVALGTANELDLLSASAGAESAALSRTGAENALLRATRDLAVSLGMGAQTELQLEPELPFLAFDYALESSIQRAIERNPSVFSAQAALEDAEIEVELAQSEGVAPLELKLLELELRRSQLELEQARRNVERSVTAGFNELVRTSESLQIVEANLTAQERRYAAMQEQFRAGLRSERELLQAEISLAQARADRFDAAGAYLQALLSFRRSIGEPLGVGSALQQGVSANAK